MTDHGGENLNHEAIGVFLHQVNELICRHPEMEPGEILTALMLVIGSTVASIQCRECRKVAARNVRRGMPESIRDALAEANECFANTPPSGSHVH